MTQGVDRDASVFTIIVSLMTILTPIATWIAHVIKKHKEERSSQKQKGQEQFEGTVAALPPQLHPTRVTTKQPSFASQKQLHRSTDDQQEGMQGTQQESHVCTLFHVPYRKNIFFTGREKVLTRLANALLMGQPTALSQPQAISGLGGVGKTQIAVEYAYQHRQEYQAILWVRADTRETLVSDYVAIAELLNLPQSDGKDQNIIVNAVLQWFKTHVQWLLILDNADDLTVMREFLPSTFGGHILLTTRAQVMGRLAQCIEVDMMELDVGALLLLRRATLVVHDASLEGASPSDCATAKEITEELGGLPLALDQAGTYIEEVRCSLADYLSLYRQDRAVLLNERGGLELDHPEPVTTTWSLSFKKVEQKNLVAADILRLCAFLQLDAIPEEIITLGAAYLGRQQEAMEMNPFTFNQAIKILRSYSLIQRYQDEHLLTIHRLVQAVLQDAMTKQEQAQWRERVIQALNAVFPDVTYAVWKQCERLIPHVLLYATENPGQAMSQDLADMLGKAANYLQGRAQYEQAESLYQRALGIKEQVLGPEHPQVASLLHGLASLYRAQGKYEQAELLFQRALHVREQALGPEHPDVATSLHGLAVLYGEHGKHKQAEPLFQQALHIREQALGPEHPDVATSLHGLANVYWAQGKYEQAEPLYRRALHIREQALGPEHWRVVGPLHGLANLYRDQGKYEQAEPLFQRSLESTEKLLGPDHPRVATLLDDLADVKLRRYKQVNVEPLYRRALAIREKKFGPEHPDTAISYNNLALMYERDGDYSKSEKLFRHALAILKKFPGPRLSAICTNLARLYAAEGKHRQAKDMEGQAAKARADFSTRTIPKTNGG